MVPLNPLRPVTQRLNSTSVEELPRYAGFLATALRSCAGFLQSPESQKNEAAIQIHKLSTKISTLLQDKTQEGRFTGTVLAKAFLEAAGSQSLTTSGQTWARSLISCLNKPDPPQAKKIFVITITRIFLLTADDQAMIREITTPSLPPFLNACLSAIKPFVDAKSGVERQVPSSLLPTVFQCWFELIKVFPSTFRPFVPSIRAIILSVLSQHITSQETKGIASQVFATLHFCAPKDNVASEWTQSIKQVIEAGHQTADVVFRSVVEDWTGISLRQVPKIASKQAASIAKAAGADAIGMEKWTGLHAGLVRVNDLVNLLGAMLTSSHSQAMRVPLAEVLDLTARLAAVLSPTSRYSLRDNKEIAREERDELYINLPRLHCTILNLYEKMATTYGRAMVQTSTSYLSQVWDILESESFDAQTRSAVYGLVKTLLQHKAILLNASDSSHIATLIRRCCGDLTSKLGEKFDVTGTIQNRTLKLDNSTMPRQKLDTDQPQSILAEEAWNLLPVILTYIPSHLMTSNSRTEIERTAILIGHKEAMLASVLSPPAPRRGVQQSVSVLPFLAQANNDSLALEALMRPRQPILRGTDQMNMTEGDGEKSESSAEDESMANDERFHVISNGSDRLIDEDPPRDLTTDVTQAKKRDHAAVDDTSKLSATESSKKAKTGLPAPQDDQRRKLISDIQRSGTDDILESIQVVDQTRVVVEEAPVELTIQHEKSSTSATKGGHAHSSSHHQQALDEDSDDSDIPQIDTALSSDDEDDELES